MNDDEAIDTVKHYWRSTEDMHKLRLYILFHDDLTGKLVLPETSIYAGDCLEDTCYELGAVTKPITRTLSELGET